MSLNKVIRNNKAFAENLLNLLHAKRNQFSAMQSEQEAQHLLDNDSITHESWMEKHHAKLQADKNFESLLSSFTESVPNDYEG